MKNVRYLKFVVFRDIEDFWRMGWHLLIPNDVYHGHYYGVEMAWLCDCKVPCK